MKIQEVAYCKPNESMSLKNPLLPKVRRGAISGYKNWNSYAAFPGYGEKKILYSQSTCTTISIRIILLVILMLNIDMKLDFYFTFFISTSKCKETLAITLGPWKPRKGRLTQQQPTAERHEEELLKIAGEKRTSSKGHFQRSPKTCRACTIVTHLVTTWSQALRGMTTATFFDPLESVCCWNHIPGEEVQPPSKGNQRACRKDQQSPV